MVPRTNARGDLSFFRMKTLKLRDLLKFAKGRILMEGIARKVLSQIDVDDAIRIAKDLIRIPGHRELPEKESKVAEYISRRFEESGITVQTKDITPCRPNVIAVVKGSGGGYSLMYNCHTDTVPVYGWLGEPGPFSALEKGGKIYGRGSCDMKGAIAATIVAMEAIHRTGVKLKGDLVFAGVIGEEGNGSIGTKDIVQNGPLTDFAVVCEPTNLKVSVGHKGSSNFLITTKGRPAHSATPEMGVNAISAMAGVLKKLERDFVPELRKKSHKLFGPPTFTPAVIQGGMRTDVVPDHCEVRVNCRYPPGVEPEEVREGIDRILQKMRRENKDFSAEVTLLGKSPGAEVAKDSMVVEALSRSVEQATGRPAEIVGSYFWTDASILVNNGKVPTALFGPGKEQMAHAPFEYVEVDHVGVSAKIFALTALEVCLKGK